MRKHRGSWKRERPWTPSFICPNCKRKTNSGHFAPPSMGEPGFWICDDIKEAQPDEQE